MATQPAIAPDIEKMKFEEAMSELEAIVKRLESGESTLDQSIDDYTRGTQLKAHCQKKLDEARLKVEKLSVAPDGHITRQPFEE